MNRAVLVIIIFIIMAIWFSALANACAPRSGFSGGGWGGPIFIPGGGWTQGGWDRGGFGSSGSSGSSIGRSSGGIGSRGGGISGGSGGK